MGTLVQDLRYGLRTLAKNPGFTAVVVLTLALGIGANTAIFSLINATLLRPLPGIEHPEQLVGLYRFYFFHGQPDYDTISYPNYKDYRDQNTVFSGLLAYYVAPMDLSGSGGEAERVQGEIVSRNYFDVLGVRVVRGRAFLPHEDKVPGAQPVAVVSYGLWKRHFGSDPELVGRIVTINGHPFTVVGITPKDFSGVTVGNPVDVWIPMMMADKVGPAFLAGWNKSRQAHWLLAIGRLKPGVSLKEAQAAMSALARQLELAFPKENAGVRLSLYPRVGLDPGLRAEARGVVGMLMVFVALVLLIACANVANLLLARVSMRRKEIAVRLAVGGTRGRLIRQLLTESVLLGLVAGGAGLMLAIWGTQGLKALSVIFEYFPALDLSPDARVFGFTFLMALATGIVFGIGPAFGCSRPNLAPALKEGQPEAGHARSLLRSLLVVSQITLSLALLIGAGLIVRTLRNYLAINPGFEVRNILNVPLDLGLEAYTNTQGQLFYQRLLDRVEALPGVRSASLTLELPISDTAWGAGMVIEGRELPPGQPFIPLHYTVVTPSYFQTLGIPLLTGRGFGDQDGPDAPLVAIINETMARRYWPHENPTGRGFRLLNDEKGPLVRIVGVAKNSKYRTLAEQPQPWAYFPLAQKYEATMTLLVRSSMKPVALLPAVRRVVQSLDLHLPVVNATTLSEHVERSLGEQTMIATLVNVFGLLALVLAVVGIYGAISYSVSQRTREIGIRVALGAGSRDVLGLVIRQGLTLVMFGISVGLAAAFVLTRLMTSMLYGVRPTDPLTYAVVAVLLAGIAVLASYIPARRATKVDPMVALRYE